MVIAIRLIALVIGYFFGVFQTGYIYGKLHGIDIREHGSGNAGATNTLRTLGMKAGAITFVGDCLKSVAAILLVTYFFGDYFAGDARVLGLYAGLGAVLGHNFPFYLKFKGGKGIACTAGVVMAVCPQAVPSCLAVFGLCLWLTKYVSLGSILMAALFMIQVVEYNFMGALGLPAENVLEYDILAIIFGVMAIWRHKANIGRLLAGTENKVGSKKEA